MSDRERNRRRMTGLVEQWAGSGQTLSAFARDHGIGRDKLEYWRRRVPSAPPARRRRPAEAITFAPVQVMASACSAAIEVTLADGVKVAIDSRAAAELAVAVLTALRRAC